MKDYLLLFRNASAPNGYLATTQDMAEDLPKWQAWIGQMALQGRLTSTAPVEYTASVVDGSGVRQGQPFLDHNHVLVSGYLICKAEKIEDVEAWSQSCPILKYPHSSVEIRPLTPYPNQ